MKGAGYYVPAAATTTIVNAARVGFNKTIGKVIGVHLDQARILDRVAVPSEAKMGSRPPKKSKSKTKKRGGKAKRSTGSKTRRVH